MLWIKVALALELIRTDLFEAMTLHFTNKPYGPQNDLDYVKEHIVDKNRTKQWLWADRYKPIYGYLWSVSTVYAKKNIYS